MCSSLVTILEPIFISYICSPDGQYVAVGGSDGTIYIWEALTGRPHKVKKDSSAHR